MFFRSRISFLETNLVISSIYKNFMTLLGFKSVLLEFGSVFWDVGQILWVSLGPASVFLDLGGIFKTSLELKSVFSRFRLVSLRSFSRLLLT